MKKFLRRLRQFFRFSWIRTADSTLRSFSASGRTLFFFFAGVCMISTAGLLYLLEASITVAAPARGGSLTEGIIGSPRFINPILALSDADRDLTALVYSGLLRATPDGEYVPDLAASYEISPDGTVYTFTLRPDITFHDGEPVTASDVLFTVHKAQAAALKSPLRANWDGVVVESPDAQTVRFTLRSPYAPFIENLTLGILPEHLWGGVSDEEFSFSELNTSPIGSGPYKASSVVRSASGIPASYELTAFNDYPLGAPYLTHLTLRFYQSEQALTSALTRGEVEAGSGLSPQSLADFPGLTTQTASLNRVFGVFFNQNQSEVLRDKAVRAALGTAIDRADLVNKVLGGYGTPLSGPVPPNVAEQALASSTSPLTPEDASLAAQNELLEDGWEMGEDGILTKTGSGKNAATTRLAFSLATGNIPELREAAEYLRAAWRRMGADVTVEVYEQGDLSQNVIRPRKYDALLFGEVIGRELDLFAFWHSSQRNDPGLNIALYANATADEALEKLRQTSSDQERASLYQTFLGELDKDIPALFLYAPDFVYSVPNDLAGLRLGFIETPSDRFLSVGQWHRQTDYVWPIFAPSGQR